MVRRCRDQGLQVEQAEAIEYLATLPAASLGAVTAMHVIEHLSLQDFVHLLDETARVLRAGGVAIFETPNPENLLVGACNFWFDPTHQRPLPPEATRFIAMQRGFAEVEILRLHPYPDDILVKDGGAQMRTKFNQFLFGPQDYAIVARKR
jgi:O-antigen chain-terminating methyltransferase